MQDLAAALQTLRTNQQELRGLGVRHAAVFGSVARGEAGEGSDLDVLIDLDPDRPIGLFGYARLQQRVSDLLGGVCDVVNRRALKPALRDRILHESVNAF